uniref:OSJNBa0032B23.8 protein n=2 Tax=Oryza sativa subsp. japonica TaxID=39947 RepID=Q7XWP4_ORYSJ|nr:OSJNBa0032B23.8 [Oryza sativa Japonica Group]
MAGLSKGIREHWLLHRLQDMTTSPCDAYEDGKYDSVAYIDWELAVDNEFDKYDFSEAQMIKAASNKFTSFALFWWSYVSNQPETWDEFKTMMRKRFVTSYYKCTLREKLEHLKQGDRTVREYIHEFKGVQNIQQKEENGVLEKKGDEAPAVSEESLQEELCDNASLISMPQLVNEHAISSVYLCADFKHVVHIANEVEEHELLSSLNTLGYVWFDDFCELENLKEKLFAKSDLPCPTNAISHIFGEYNDRGIYLGHRVYICSYLEPSVHVDKTSKLERNVTANKIISSLACFDWKKQVVLNGLREKHHMEKPGTVFHKDGEDDVTMATTDTTITHIMDEQADMKIKSSKCWNSIRPPTTLLTSNGRRICMRPPFSARIRLICTGKINNPWRGVSIAKAQHNNV